MGLVTICLSVCIFCCCVWGQAVKESTMSFAYGEPFAAVATYRRIEPSRGRLDISEACEGDTVGLSCPTGATIQFANHSYFHFGRSGPWEKNTSCGKGAVVANEDDISKQHHFLASSVAANCSTVNGQRLLTTCSGRYECTVQLIGLFPGRDPCPLPVRKYLIFRYFCVLHDVEMTDKRELSSVTPFSGLSVQSANKSAYSR
jgi:hypothetical protein